MKSKNREKDIKHPYPGMVFKKDYEPRYFYDSLAYGRLLKPTKNPRKHFDYRTRETRNLLDTEEYFCVSTFKNCNEGRTKENAAFVLCCFLDLDGVESREVQEDEVRARLKKFHIREPVIINTSPGHYHMKFYLQFPVDVDSKKQIETWRRVQSALHKAFEDLGSDRVVIHDTTRLLRNEFAEGVIREWGEYVNENRRCVYKITNRFEVKTVEWGCGWHSLSELYGKLAVAGYIEKPKRPDKYRWVHMQTRAWQLLVFLKRNPSLEYTQEELGRRTGIPLRTLKRLIAWMRDKRMLGTETVSVEKKRYTQFTLLSTTNGFRSKVHMINIEDFTTQTHTSTCPVSTEIRPPLPKCQDIISLYNRVHYTENRNIRLFTATAAVRELRKGVSVEEVLWELHDGIRMYESEDFDRREIEKTITSALRPKYRGFRFPKEYLKAGGYLI